MLVDIIIIALLALFVFIGWKRGLVMSVFLLASTILAIFLASIFAPVVSTGLEKLGVADKLAPKFSAQVEEAIAEELGENAVVKLEIATDKLPLPSFVKEEVVQKIDEVAEAEVSEIADSIGLEAAKIVCVLIAFVIVFILVLIMMQVVKGVLKIAVSLPLVKQVDKIGGIAIGFVQGALFILVALLFISIFSSYSCMQTIVKEIEKSTITNFIYESNLIGEIISKLL